MNRVYLGIAATLVVAAFVAGFWPQHRQLTTSQALTETLQTRLDAAETRIRMGQVLGQLLRLSDAIRLRNYGEAAALSSTYFDTVRQEASRTDADGAVALNAILASRDQVTTAIAGADPTLDVNLRQHEQQLRRVLGYPVSAP